MNKIHTIYATMLQTTSVEKGPLPKKVYYKYAEDLVAAILECLNSYKEGFGFEITILGSGVSKKMDTLKVRLLFGNSEKDSREYTILNHFWLTSTYTCPNSVSPVLFVYPSGDDLPKNLEVGTFDMGDGAHSLIHSLDQIHDEIKFKKDWYARVPAEE